MQIRIPTFIQTHKSPQGTRYVVRPLFFPTPARFEPSLSRAMSKFTQDLSKELGRLGRAADQSALARWTFSPPIVEHRVDVVIELRRKTIRGRVFLAVLKQFDRKIAFSPVIPDVWFDLQRGETLAARASEVYSAHFRQLEKNSERELHLPPELLMDGTAWIEPIELDVSLGYKVPPEDKLLAFLGGPQAADGTVELVRVGRCLNWMFGDLDRVVGREREVAELRHWLTAEDQRPVLLVGPRLVGKTAIIHEYVHQVTALRTMTYRQRENVWLLSPQRLVSGMSFVGQWEQRLLAILKVAKRRQHTLYFDDLLGLYQAGQSRDSSLSMAHVLKPYLERREFRMLAEITPEALGVLRERDRSLADLFHVIPIEEPAERETWRILLGVQRRLEIQHRSQFKIDALPAVVDFQRRYVRDGVFPGKGARFLEQLAVQAAGGKVDRDRVTREFHQQSGLCLDFLDPRKRLERKSLIETLAARLIGQPQAIEAVADVLSVAKARLNDPTRPLASLLFLGPTGVGKTECAKALAGYLFGDAERLLRFDMNEYVGVGSAARLMGTFAQPEGLLTSAVRRQPFAVILLDEIEKAHPEVFDVLLQVLGEGRLTDALGRTVDFTNTIVILTSNLGVREASGKLGFQPSKSDEPIAFARAAEKFFRPEFFNRLDRIVPFGHLDREHVAQIAKLVIQEVFARDGLTRRKCMLHVEDQTLDQVVTMGYSPTYGARALKRSIERQLTQPVADRLSALRPETPTIVRLYPDQAGIAVQLEPLVDAEPAAGSLAALLATGKSLGEPGEIVARVEQVVARITAEAEADRPRGPVIAGQIEPAQLRYFALREQLTRVRDLCEKAAESLRPRKSGKLPTASNTHLRGGLKRVNLRDGNSMRRLLGAMSASQDLVEFFRELGQSAVAFSRPEEDALELVREAVLLESMRDAMRQKTGESVLLHLQVFGAATYYPNLKGQYHYGLAGAEVEFVPFAREATTPVPGREVRRPESSIRSVLVIHGPHAQAVARLEEGTHLFCPKRGGMVPMQVIAHTLLEGEHPLAAHKRLMESRSAWLAERVAGKATTDSDPFRLRPVVRIYDEQGSSIDVRTGLLGRGFVAHTEELWVFLMSALPLPAELLSP